MTYQHKNSGVCSRSVTFDLDENGILHNVRFDGGCNGNTQGLSLLAEGQPAREVMARLRGVRCGMRTTSCPDQLACAIEDALAEQ